MKASNIPFEEYCGVRFSSLGVTSVKNHRPLRFVPKVYVKKIVVNKGYISENPLLLSMLGVLLIGLSVEPFVRVFLHILGAGQPVSSALGMFFLPAGLWVLFESLRRGEFLEVIQDGGRQKFPFYEPPEPEALQTFFRTAEELGYVVEMPYNRNRNEDAGASRR